VAKLSKKAQKAKRSEAARKGWKTRKARELEEERKRLRAKREREKRKRERERERERDKKKPKRKTPEKPKRKTPEKPKRKTPEKPKRKPKRKTPEKPKRKPKRKPEKPKYPFPWMKNLDEQRPKLFPWIDSGETVKEQIERWNLFELCFNAVQRGGNSMLLVQQMFPEYTLRELYSIGYGSP